MAVIAPEYEPVGLPVLGGADREWLQPGAARINGALRTQAFQHIGRPGEPLPENLEAAFFQSAWEAYSAHGDRARGVKVFYDYAVDDGRPHRLTRTINHPPDAGALQLEALLFDIGVAPAGSDEIPLEYDMTLDRFEITWVEPPGAGKGRASYSKTETPLFTLRDYKGAEGDCLLNILRAVSANPPRERNASLRARLRLPPGNIALDQVGRVAEHFGFNVRVHSAELDIRRAFRDSPHEGNHCEATAAPMVLAEAVHDPTKPLVEILLDAGHYWHVVRVKAQSLCPVTGDPLTTRTTAKLRARVLEQGRPWFHAKKRRTRALKHFKERILVFDFETVWDPRDCDVLKPYSVGWFEFPASRLTAENGADFSREVERFKAGDLPGAACVFSRYNTRAQPLWGCATELVRHILAAPEDVRYTLVGFNNSAFDNFLLARAAEDLGVLTAVFWAGNQLRDIAITRHRTLDLCRIVTSSLDAACKGFSTVPRKVAGFSHLEPQNAFMDGQLHRWVAEHAEQLCVYQMADVFSTASLCVKIERAMGAILSRGGTSVTPLADHVGTCGGLAWKAFTTFTPPERLPRPAPSEEIDRFFRAAIVGGRTQCVAGENRLHLGPIRMVDVTSLYPTVMAHARADLFPPAFMYGHFPLGEPLATENYVPGRIGFYRVTVKRQPPGLPNVLPLRALDEDGEADRAQPLQWTFAGEFETTTTNVSIEVIRHYGGEVVVHSGYYFAESTRDMFADFLAPIIEEKSRQDMLKAEGAADYNPALRETAKLLMNSLSGKFAQRNFEDQCVLAKGAHAQISAERKMRGGRAEWVPLTGDTCMLIGKKDEAAVYSASRAKPSHVAALIYEYARTFMYHLILSRYAVHYMDTDSAAISAADYEDFRRRFPQLDPEARMKQLGDLEEEGLAKLRDGRPIGDTGVCYFLKPKCYFIGYESAGGEVLPFEKQKCKGISFRRDRLLPDANLAAYDRMDSRQLHELYNRPAKQSGAYRLVDGRPRLVGGEPKLVRPLAPNALEFFVRLHENGRAAVLSSQMMKTLVPGRGFIMRQRYLIKAFGERAGTIDRVPRRPDPITEDEPKNVGEPLTAREVATLEDVEAWLNELLASFPN